MAFNLDEGLARLGKIAAIPVAIASGVGAGVALYDIGWALSPIIAVGIVAANAGFFLIVGAFTALRWIIRGFAGKD